MMATVLLDAASTSPLALGVLVGAGYLLVVQALRYRWQRANEDLVQSVCKGDKELDPETARQVLYQVATIEFPLVYRLSLEFALFRTYGIPSISKLLQSTKVFERECGKRYDDTDLLLAELTQNPFFSKRSTEALQRINAIHAQYPSISNDDMRYVLGLFIMEPNRWIEKYEWRSLTKQEYQAFYIAWKKIGQDFGIQDIPASLEEYEKFSEEYETKNLKYAPSNVVIGKATIALFLGLVPKFLHGLGHEAAYCLMDKRLREAMAFPEETLRWMQVVLDVTLKLRKWVLRYLCLPRPQWLRARRIPFAVGADGKFCPRFHVYERTYANGYETNKLGAAPEGKLMTGCPKWR